eukprot:2322630-Rhodomonas_salina.2
MDNPLTAERVVAACLSEGALPFSIAGDGARNASAPPTRAQHRRTLRSMRFEGGVWKSVDSGLVRAPTSYCPTSFPASFLLRTTQPPQILGEVA